MTVRIALVCGSPAQLRFATGLVVQLSCLNERCHNGECRAEHEGRSFFWQAAEPIKNVELKFNFGSGELPAIPTAPPELWPASPPFPGGPNTTTRVE
jgi:hypothetical protein